MSIHLRDHGLTFVPVPKTACTSFKHLIFRIENGFDFQEYKANGEFKFVHDAAYPTLTHASWLELSATNPHRITIVRDPIKRFISAYSNRVVFYRELSDEKAGSKLRKYRIPADPDLSTFADNFKKYLRVSPSIDHHFRPLVDFVGQNASYYTRVFRFDEIGECAKHICEITGAAELPLPHDQTGGPKVDVTQLTSSQLSKIHKFYRADYRYFGDYF